MKQFVKDITDYIRKAPQKAVEANYLVVMLYCVCIALAICTVTRLCTLFKLSKSAVVYTPAQLEQDFIASYDQLAQQHEDELRDYIIEHKNSFKNPSLFRKSWKCLRDHAYAVVPSAKLPQEILVKKLIEAYMELKNYVNAHPALKSQREVNFFLDTISLYFEAVKNKKNPHLLRKRIAFKKI